MGEGCCGDRLSHHAFPRLLWADPQAPGSESKNRKWLKIDPAFGCRSTAISGGARNRSRATELLKMIGNEIQRAGASFLTWELNAGSLQAQQERSK
jgi:hypothetical protein